jgi:alginate O-acetyltransferase complex protein AlgI
MVFSSVTFLAWFLPPVLILCAALRKSTRWMNGLLLAASLIFYAYGDAVRIALLLSCALVTHLCAKGIRRCAGHRGRNLFAAASAVFSLGLLAVYKYAGFAVQSVNALLGADFYVPVLALPIGISFFTFQALSYVLDIRRHPGTRPASFADTLLYLSLFPQLVAGPIVRWNEIREPLKHRTLTADACARGLIRFSRGLAKKVLLADMLAKCADAAFSCPPGELSWALAWLGAAAYTLQIYLDFSGYSDMALGMGQMLGFALPENFRSPFRAASMRAFWRDWHITLTAWFKEYVYIPLGGSRAGKVKTCRNIMVVFALTGLWHGASWTMVIWGLYNGLFVMLERTFAHRQSRWPRAAGRVYMSMAVMTGFVFFRSDSIAHAAEYLKRMFIFAPLRPEQAVRFMAQLSPVGIAALLAGAVVSSRAPYKDKAPTVMRMAAALGLAALCLMTLEGSGYHPFIYFRF